MNKAIQPVPVHSPRPPARKAAHLQLYQALVEPGAMDPTRLFAAGLDLLVAQLDVDSAVMSRVSDLGFEAIWWATRDGIAPGPEVHDPDRTYCTRVLDEPGRTLVIRDAQADPAFQDHPAQVELGVRAFIGVPLRTSDATLGVLSVQSRLPRHFSRKQVILVNLVANFLSKAMEIELLKHELHSTRENLDLTLSVVKESALEAHDSGLPNRAYLEVWLRAYLFLARRRGETLAVVLWSLPPSRETWDRLKDLAERARGEDLLVDLGRGSYAMLLPRTTPQGAEIVLDRVRDQLGPLPMGATLWHPGNPADADDLSIRDALRRAMAALRRCRERAADKICRRALWDLPEIVQARRA